MDAAALHSATATDHCTANLSPGTAPPWSVVSPSRVERAAHNSSGAVRGRHALSREAGTSTWRRQEEGTAAEGYTLGEACVLARSSMASQRAAALHLLTAVLAQVPYALSPKP